MHVGRPQVFNKEAISKYSEGNRQFKFWAYVFATLFADNKPIGLHCQVIFYNVLFALRLVNQVFYQKGRYKCVMHFFFFLVLWLFVERGIFSNSEDL